MKKIIIIGIISFLNTALFAQDTYLRWADHFREETGMEVSGRSVTVDNMGNVYTIGVFFGNADFDPGAGSAVLTSNGEADIFISKLDANGNFIWAKKIGGVLYDYADKIVLDQEGNIVITGFFKASVDFDPGSGVFTMTAGGGQDIYILKLNTQGDFLWAKQISTDGNDFGRGIVVDATGNIYITGLYFSTAAVDFDPGPAQVLIPHPCQSGLFLLKLGPNGNFIWVKTFTGCNSSADGYDLAIDGSGNVYITGQFVRTIDFDPGPATYNVTSLSGGALNELFVVKLNSTGDFIWVKTIGISVGPNSITVDNAEDIYITGKFNYTTDFDPGPDIFILTNTSSYSDCFILKLDNSGNFIWAKSIGGPGQESGNKLKTDYLGNVYTIDFFEGLVDFDPGSGIFTLQSKGWYDIFISKLDQNGNFLWAKSIGNTGLDGGTAMYIDDYKNIYISGLFEGTVDFDPELPVYNLTAIRYGGYVVKLGQCATATSSTLTISTCNSYTLNSQTYTLSGSYTQMLNNSAGCDSIITLNLTINRKFTSVDATICEGQTYYAGGANQTIAGIYKDTLLTSLGCDSIITTYLKVNPKPKPNLGPDGNLCTNTQASITPGIFSNYLWQDNSIQPDFIITGTGKYWVTVTDANNCLATDTLTILSIDTIPENFLPVNQQLCYGGVLRIDVPNYATYQWSTGSTNDHIDISSLGTFYLAVKDFNNCIGTDSIIVTRKNCIYIGIPNAFTPNGDTRNDVFKPTIFQVVKSFSFIVFNRYGQKVFETTEYGKGWDGTFKGKPQSSGSYVYNIRYTNIFGTETVENGSVLLIR